MRLLTRITALILRSHSERNGVSKGVPGCAGNISSILRDAPSALLGMRADGIPGRPLRRSLP
jgi:hypothetical protein